MTEDTSAKVSAEEAVIKELNGRVEEFNKELLPLLGKYELGLGASAFINPNGTIGARPIMFDARKKEEASAAAAPASPEAPAPIVEV
jgi:hypothetical protein